MDIDTIRRKITALENKNQVNYASVSGNSIAISNNGASITIDSKGDAICTNNIIANNVSEDNDDRLRECEWELDHLDEKYALKNHNHFISEVIGLQDIIDDIMESIDSTNNPNINVGPFNINLNGKEAEEEFASKKIYDSKLTGDIESPTTTAKIVANGGLQVNDVPVSMEGHTHSDFEKIRSSVNIAGKTSNFEFDGTAIKWKVLATPFEYQIDTLGIKYDNGSLNIQSNSDNLMIDGEVSIKGNKVLTEADNVLKADDFGNVILGDESNTYIKMNSSSSSIKLENSRQNVYVEISATGGISVYDGASKITIKRGKITFMSDEGNVSIDADKIKELESRIAALEAK